MHATPLLSDLLSLPDPKTIVLVVGCFLLVVGVLGGGMEVKEIKIPAVERTPRVLAGVLGLALLVVSLGFPQVFSSAAAGAAGVASATQPSATQPPATQPSITQPSAIQPSATDQPIVGAGTLLNSTEVHAIYSKGPQSSDGSLPVFMTRELTAEDVQGKSKMQLDEMRNEIYARHGRLFNNPSIQRYFSAQPWYHGQYAPANFPQKLLTPVQSKNISLLLNWEYGKQ